MTWIKNLLGAIVYKYVADCPMQRGKHRLLKLSARFISGAAIKSRYGPTLRAKPLDGTNLYAMIGGYGRLISNHLNQLAPGDLFIDVGANLGLYSLLAAERVKDDGLVLSFEPSFREYAQLLANRELNGVHNLMPLNAAISECLAIVGLETGEGTHTGANRITPSGKNKALTMNLNTNEWTNLARGFKRVFIKIDTEGHEASVLKGMADILNLESVHSVIVEIDESNLSEQGSSRRAIYAMMEELNFNFTQPQDSSHYDEIFVRSSLAILHKPMTMV